MSPVMHNAAFSALGLSNEFEYRACVLEGARLPDLVQSILTGQLQGANITIPYKSRIIEHVPVVSNIGFAVGSVNTLYREKGTVVGCNTDVRGFERAIEEADVSLQTKKATLIGAGGAARAVSFSLARSGLKELTIFNRSLPKARSLANLVRMRSRTEVKCHNLERIENKLAESSLLVNCTPVGMTGHSSDNTPIPAEVLSRVDIVMDLIYNPLRTQLLRKAQESGCKTINGLTMLVQQGAASFEIWTGKKAPINVMKKAVLKALKGGNS